MNPLKRPLPEDEGGVPPPLPTVGLLQVRSKKRRIEPKLEVDAEAVKELKEEMLDGIDDSWHDILESELDSENGSQVLMRLSNSLAQKKDVFPPIRDILNAFKLTPMSKVKVVILGQDPYHNRGQAMGLAFSVPQSVKKMPPSLPRILREAGIPKELANQCGDLTSWAEQGVLLLNPVLTVEKGQPGSHAKWGWQHITSEALAQLSKQTTNRKLVFLLWGAKAAAAEALIDHSQHVVLKAAHPSPLATKGDFVGCSHFEKANECLIEQGLRPIVWDSPVREDWRLPEEIMEEDDHTALPANDASQNLLQPEPRADLQIQPEPRADLIIQAEPGSELQLQAEPLATLILPLHTLEEQDPQELATQTIQQDTAVPPADNLESVVCTTTEVESNVAESTTIIIMAVVPPESSEPVLECEPIQPSTKDSTQKTDEEESLEPMID